MICSDDNSWSLVALFDGQCRNNNAASGSSVNNTIEGLWPYYDQINSIAGIFAAKAGKKNSLVRFIIF